MLFHDSFRHHLKRRMSHLSRILGGVTAAVVAVCLTLAVTPSFGQTDTKRKPVIVGFDVEYGVKNSTSAQAIEDGLKIAIH